ncbi:hypothetical protein EBR21_02075 [bacterium]|nr:hypothetical protein [bacterium]
MELERSAARIWWSSEDRAAWRDDLLRRLDSQPTLFFKSFLKESCPRFEVLTWDEDLLRCFSTTRQQHPVRNFGEIVEKIQNIEHAHVLGVLPRPGFWLTDTWHEEEDILRESLSVAKKKQALVVRCGFVTEQSDILMAAELGFSGVQIHAAGLDLFELQMLIELARDCRMSPIVSISDSEQMNTMLQTDAPHVALCCLAGEGFEDSIRFVQSALPSIPSNCTKILLAAALDEKEVMNFTRLGFQSVMTLV